MAKHNLINICAYIKSCTIVRKYSYISTNSEWETFLKNPAKRLCVQTTVLLLYAIVVGYL